ncbi:YdeI family protein [Tabrizicola sp.]|uniref:YdeI/OmpD-associated family protein n=1 Tax=Tabrizicola sp. TaxID=2005166 RepID=UPI0025D43C0D|nr:YdeI/OmpD-associated family protein [Tabrizicola sp.]
MTDEPLPFATPADWRAWLNANHAARTEVTLKLYKKASGTPSITWEEAVVEALAFGWIDGVKRPGGPDHWLQRFTPRKPRSSWSQKNRAHAEKLIADGRMAPAGQAQVDAAKADGRWDNAYAGGKTAQVPADFLAALEGNPAAKATYATLNAQNRFALYYRLTTAKRPETRAKRMADYLAMLEKGERFH